MYGNDMQKLLVTDCIRFYNAAGCTVPLIGSWANAHEMSHPRGAAILVMHRQQGTELWIIEHRALGSSPVNYLTYKPESFSKRSLPWPVLGQRCLRWHKHLLLNMMLTFFKADIDIYMCVHITQISKKWVFGVASANVSHISWNRKCCESQF